MIRTKDIPWNRFLGALVFWGAVGASIGGPAPVDARDKVTIGRLEKVWIKEAGIVLDAKVDTGTQTSSLSAGNITLIKKGAHSYVRFTIRDTRKKMINVEAPLVRMKEFKDKVGRTTSARPIVLLGLCIGGLYRHTQVNLSDRGQLTFPILIGRRFLFGYAVVDVAKKYSEAPHCPQMQEAR